MADRLIRKTPSGAVAAARPPARERLHTGFSWERARRELQGLPGGAGLNIAHEALDRHVRGGTGNRIALKCLDTKGARRDYSYADLQQASARFANVLRALGIGGGDCVVSLLGRSPEVYITAFGTLRNGSVFCPLFSAFGPEPVEARLAIAGARVLVTTARLYQRKVAPIRGALPSLEHVLIVQEAQDADRPSETVDLRAALNAASAEHRIGATDPGDPALLHFTSGTTGTPKGAVHVHEAVVAHHATAALALDLQAGDVFWCTADPGWVTGTSYGLIAPLSIGASVVVDAQEFDAERWYRVLEDQRVSVWYTAPTAVRMLMKVGRDLPHHYDLDCLRFIASVGEPLNPEAVLWGQQAFGCPIHDNWWQTETGAIMICNDAATDIKPGSMGKPVPGIEAAIVRRSGEDDLEPVEQPDTQGELALRAGWPSMFRGYLGDELRYQRCFRRGWYLSGDLARRDADGYYWFIGRADDVIKSAGHLVGPFEIENVLMEHPAVAEAGAIGKPDALAMEVVKAFVELKPGYRADEALRRELLAHARKRLGAAIAPKEIEFRSRLPKTRSGKIMRRLLKARELGLPEGDVSSLESDG